MTGGIFMLKLRRRNNIQETARGNACYFYVQTRHDGIKGAWPVTPKQMEPSNKGDTLKMERSRICTDL